MARKESEDKFLNELIKDCITYRLEESEALQYIGIRFNQPLSLAAYKHRKARVLAEDSTQLWLNHFTRIGFVQHHKNQIEVIEAIQKDSLRQFFIETNRTVRDEDIIKSLKSDIRENTKLLSELGLGTPIISAIKAKMNEDRQNQQKNMNNNNINYNRMSVCSASTL